MPGTAVTSSRSLQAIMVFLKSTFSRSVGVMRIAIVGGTGKEGSGLAIRWGRAGHVVIIGSRDGEKARARAAELTAAGHGAFEGGDNLEAAREGELVVLTVPYGAHAETLRAIQPGLSGKVLVDVTVPLVPPKVSRVQLPAGQAAALEAQQILGAQTQVVARDGDRPGTRPRSSGTGRGSARERDRAGVAHPGSHPLEQALQELWSGRRVYQSSWRRLSEASRRGVSRRPEQDTPSTIFKGVSSAAGRRVPTGSQAIGEKTSPTVATFHRGARRMGISECRWGDLP